MLYKCTPFTYSLGHSSPFVWTGAVCRWKILKPVRDTEVARLKYQCSRSLCDSVEQNIIMNSFSVGLLWQVVANNYTSCKGKVRHTRHTAFSVFQSLKFCQLHKEPVSAVYVIRGPLRRPVCGQWGASPCTRKTTRVRTPSAASSVMSASFTSLKGTGRHPCAPLRMQQLLSTDLETQKPTAPVRLNPSMGACDQDLSNTQSHSVFYGIHSLFFFFLLMRLKRKREETIQEVKIGHIRVRIIKEGIRCKV